MYYVKIFPSLPPSQTEVYSVNGHLCLIKDHVFQCEQKKKTKTIFMERDGDALATLDIYC